MSTNQYIFITDRMGSCLLGGRAYCAISTEDAFEQALLEECRDTLLQKPGRSYMQVRSCTTEEKLWMVPFAGNEEMLDLLLDAMEIALPVGACASKLHFPIDVAVDQGQYAYLLRPMERDGTVPIRSIMPDTEAPRWDAAISLFERVRELHGMGLTSNGFSREQMRCERANGDVHLWLTERMRPVSGQNTAEKVSHGGFLAIPARTEKICRKMDIPISGKQRDMFSAAVSAFYLIVCEHPFVGAQYALKPRQMYLEMYHKGPDYVLRSGTENYLGAISSSLLKRKHLEQMVPELRQLFDQMFMAVTSPVENWDPELECWNLENWTEALCSEKQCNDNETRRIHFDFSNSVYHIV